jgi:uncharacterized protein YbjQ (UPF0145 family)
MIVSKTDNIPTKRIVSVLGNISIKRAEAFSENEEKSMQKLIRKAERMGANAIINFSYRGSGTWGVYSSCSGLAVIIEDINNNLDHRDKNKVYCRYCGKIIRNLDRFCRHCGSKQ